MSTPSIPEWTPAHEALYQSIKHDARVTVQLADKAFTIQQRCTNYASLKLCCWYDIRRADGTLARNGVFMEDRELRDVIRLWLQGGAPGSESTL